MMSQQREGCPLWSAPPRQFPLSEEWNKSQLAAQLFSQSWGTGAKGWGELQLVQKTSVQTLPKESAE